MTLSHFNSCILYLVHTSPPTNTLEVYTFTTRTFWTLYRLYVNLYVRFSFVIESSSTITTVICGKLNPFIVPSTTITF